MKTMFQINKGIFVALGIIIFLQFYILNIKKNTVEIKFQKEDSLDSTKLNDLYEFLTLEAFKDTKLISLSDEKELLKGLKMMVLNDDIVSSQFVQHGHYEYEEVKWFSQVLKG